jgi:hypothetical protein
VGGQGWFGSGSWAWVGKVGFSGLVVGLMGVGRLGLRTEERKKKYIKKYYLKKIKSGIEIIVGVFLR